MYSREQNNTTHSARHGAANTPEHSNHIYLPNSSLIGDPDAVAWLRAARCTAAGRHRASQAAIASTASLHRTPPFQAAKSKAFLIISGRGAAVALVAARRDHYPSHSRAPCTRCHSDLDGRTRTVLARAAMSLDSSGDHHAANGRDGE